ncbi:LysM peptidoglycan-binding domain-containing protein [Lentilactobacillus raoultii]|uniref:LysM peptidoglycan-binding domain-containing protein n=1 Tax=Lentilactobacillus raoultii TaxID=1987503 RepID=A0ABW3PKF9_9LACO|nr:LysM peptidoglycan-binding domain-containing protein [Lentilactobacillus raoultii]
MNTNGDHKHSEEDQPWNQTFSEDRDEQGHLSRVKLRQQSHNHNMITVILVSLIIIVALVSLIYGIAKQSAAGNRSTNHHPIVAMPQQAHSKKKSSKSTSIDHKAAQTALKSSAKAKAAGNSTKVASASSTTNRSSTNQATSSTGRTSNAASVTRKSNSTSSALKPNTNNPTTTASNGYRYATVQAGQGIYRVAVNNGLTMSQLMQMNGLSTASQIHPGERLRVK